MKDINLILTDEGYLPVKDLTRDHKVATDKRMFNKESVIREKEPVELFHPRNLKNAGLEKFYRVVTECGLSVDLTESDSLIEEKRPFEQKKVRCTDLKIGTNVTLQSGRGIFGKIKGFFRDGLQAGFVLSTLNLLGDSSVKNWDDIKDLHVVKNGRLLEEITKIGSKYKKALEKNNYRTINPLEDYIMIALYNCGLQFFSGKLVDRFDHTKLYVDGYLSAIFNLLGVYNPSGMEDESYNDSYFIPNNDRELLENLQLLLLNSGIFSYFIDVKGTNQIAFGKKLYSNNKYKYAIKVNKASQSYLHKELSIFNLKKPRKLRFDIRCRIHTSKIKEIYMLEYAPNRYYMDIDKPVIINGFNVFTK